MVIDVLKKHNKQITHIKSTKKKSKFKNMIVIIVD